MCSEIFFFFKKCEFKSDAFAFLPNFVHHTFPHLYSTAVAVLNEEAPGIQLGSHPRKIIILWKIKKSLFIIESSPLKIYEIQIYHFKVKNMTKII